MVLEELEYRMGFSEDPGPLSSPLPEFQPEMNINSSEASGSLG